MLKIETLFGEHMFSGVQVIPDTGKGGKVLFVIDGTTYCAYEDPDDGYRSYFSSINILSNKKPNITFKPQRVVITGCEDGIQILNIKTGEPILLLYTDHGDYYYPYCNFTYNPENMEINKERN